MAWLDLFRKQTQPVLAAPGAAVQGPVAQGTSIEVINGGTATPLDRTAMAMLQEYNRALYLWRCVDMIGQMSASVVLEVAPLQTRPVNEAEAQVQRLLLRPNPQWDAASLQYWVTTSLSVANRAFLKRVRSDLDGSTLELWPVPANEVVVVYSNGSQEVARFERTYGMKKEVYPVDPKTGDCDLIFIRRPALSWKTETSPAAVAAPPAEVFTRILQRCADIVSNNSNITGILSTEAELAKTALAAIKARLMQFRTGATESGGVLVTANAKWSLTRTSEDPSNALSVEIKDSLARDVAMTFGVPTQLLGLPGQDTYNNLSAARVGFLTETILPGYISVYVSALNHSLMVDLAATIKPNIAAIPSMAAARLQLVDTAKSATMLTLNEQRLLLGYSRYEDEEADVPVLLEQMRVARLKVESGAGGIGAGFGQEPEG
jgi:phage portal protein BeeE